LASEHFQYKDSLAQSQRELVEATKKKEILDGAMRAAEWIANMDLTLKERNPKAWKFQVKMRKKLEAEYGDLLNLEGEDEDEEDDE
jgi:hypothetical protein